MKKMRIPWLLAVGALTLSSVRCGTGSENPAALQAPASGVVAGESGSAAASGLPIDAATATQPWTIQDACSDGKGIRTRLWEANRLKLTGRVTRTFATRTSLGTLRFRLLCVKGTNSCLGATTNPASALMWGVGYNAERKPALAFCKACSGSGVTMRLVCVRRADGSFGSSLVEDLGGAEPDGDLSASSLSDEGLADFAGEAGVE